MQSPKWAHSRHYYKDGELRDTARAYLKEVFFENCVLDEGRGCWLFGAGTTTQFRYQQFWFADKRWQAHRFAWLLWRGEVPDGMFILHSCDVRPCVNPDHLRVGTQADNMQDKLRRGRYRNSHSDKTHCPQGHEYTTENTYRYRKSRICRACHKNYSNAYARRIQRDHSDWKNEKQREYRAKAKVKS